MRSKLQIGRAREVFSRQNYGHLTDKGDFGELDICVTRLIQIEINLKKVGATFFKSTRVACVSIPLVDLGFRGSALPLKRPFRTWIFFGN